MSLKKFFTRTGRLWFAVSLLMCQLTESAWEIRCWSSKSAFFLSRWFCLFLRGSNPYPNPTLFYYSAMQNLMRKRSRLNLWAPFLDHWSASVLDQLLSGIFLEKDSLVFSVLADIHLKKKNIFWAWVIKIKRLIKMRGVRNNYSEKNSFCFHFFSLCI